LKLILFTLLISTITYAKKDKRDLIYEESYKQYKSLNYFSALETIARMYRFQTPDQNTQNYLERLVQYTGTHYFNTYSDLELRKMNIPTTDLIMAKRNLYLRKFKYVHKRLKRMPKGHRLFAESLMVRATAYYLNKEMKKAVEYFDKCVTKAQEWEDSTENKTKNYFSVIKESCIIDIARTHFKNGDFEKAIRHYEDIPKTSIKWPYILLEKAWSYYYLGKHNKSLGLLITYDSPLLESYFMPEAEVLKAMNYYQMCLYEDALFVIENYYNKYKPRSEALKKVIRSKSRKDLAFYEMMFSPISESEKENRFLRNLITQMSKRVKYNLDLNSLYQLNKEIFRDHKDANMKMLITMQRDLKEQINHYVKVSMFSFVNEIHKLSESMFNLKLEVLAKQRDLVYKSRDIRASRSRGNVKNLDKSKYQEFWSFNNAFWADELGEYTFALDNNCKVKSLKGFRR
jgi:tetratricopeptide (TPR) repeat protein